MLDDHSSQIGPVKPSGDGLRNGASPRAEGESSRRQPGSPTGADFVPTGLPTEKEKTIISKSPPIASDSSLPVAIRPNEMGRELEGQRLNHFVLEEFVGGGGMGAVFRAIDTELGRTVAVKVVARDQTDEDVLRRFKNEAQSAARLDHPNIARVYYVGQDRGWNYIVFEYIEGVNVRDLVDHKGPLSLDEAIHYTRQVAEALEHASRRDVVHRDIKPSNVLVMPDGRVKLVDMGLARLHQVEASAEDLTASGVTLGTFDYISPEQARDPRNTDVRSDLYSLGCTIYFMLTGLPPFPQGTVLQKLLSHSSDPPPDPRRLRPDLPEELVRIVLKLLAKQPDKRHQRPSDLVGELILLADELGLPHADQGGAVWVTTETPQRSWIERHLPWIAPTLMLLGMVVLIELSSRPSQSTAIPDPTLATRATTTVTAAEIAPLPRDEEASVPGVEEADASSTQDEPASIESTTSDAASAAGLIPPRPPSSAPRADGPSNGSPPADAAVAEPMPGAIADVLTEPATSSPSVLPTEPAVTAAPGPMPALDVDDMQVEEMANERVRSIIVGSANGSAPADDERIVESLAKAARVLRDLPNVDQILLRGDVFIEEPFALADRTLEIRAAAGFHPVIVFRPTEGELIRSRRMIQLVGGSVSWHGLHFRFELPTVSTARYTLFSVNQLDKLDFQACSMTVVNSASSGVRAAATPAFFEVEAAQPGGMMDASSQPPRMQPIDLHDCVARGEAVFIRMSEATPVQLQWTQGLLVTTQRLLETGGVEFDPLRATSVVRLRAMTIRADQGLCRLDSTLTPNQFGLRLEIWNSLIATQPGAPLVEHLGLPGEQYENYVDGRFAFDGANNCYPETDPATAIRWQIGLKEHDEAQVVYKFDATDELWYRETAVSFRDPWIQPPPSTPVHTHLPEDYAIESADSDATSHGFEPASLPPVPAPPNAIR